jgi:hypothetical protein
MFDSNRAFAIQLPVLAKESCPLLYAILAIGARQQERKERIQSSFDSLELYQEAIRLLAPLLQARDTHVIAACVVLCCLEMFSASAQDWRRHLEGCAAVFDAFGVNGFSGDVLQAVFWCYARMDVCGALISDGAESTLLKPEKLLPPFTSEELAESLFCNASSADMYANYAIYLCAKACKLISERNRFVELGEENGCNAEHFHDRWFKLWDQLSRWNANRPREVLPIGQLYLRTSSTTLHACCCCPQVRNTKHYWHPRPPPLFFGTPNESVASLWQILTKVASTMPSSLFGLRVVS